MHRIPRLRRRGRLGVAIGMLTLGVALVTAAPAFAQSGPTQSGSQQPQPAQPCPPEPTSTPQPSQLDWSGRPCTPNQSNRPNQPNQQNQPDQRDHPNDPSQPDRPNQRAQPSQPSPQPQAARIGRVATDRADYHRGDRIRVTFRGDDNSVIRETDRYRCAQVNLEVLTPGGWRPYAELDGPCSTPGIATAFDGAAGAPPPVQPFGGEHTATLPPDIPDGTYRIVTRVITPDGVQHTFYSVPFTVG
jgi:hypothetical protein